MAITNQDTTRVSASKSSNKRGYALYLAKISQTGTNAPTVNTLVLNDTGLDFTLAYIGQGDFQLQCSSDVFVEGGTSLFFHVNETANGLEESFIQTEIGGVNNYEITTYISGLVANGVLDNVLMELRIYD